MFTAAINLFLTEGEGAPLFEAWIIRIYSEGIWRAVIMAVLGLFSNYYLVYPIYTNIMPMEAILGMYKTLNPAVDNLWEALIFFNVPFTFGKGMISAVVTLLTYKKLEPVINGRVV